MSALVACSTFGALSGIILAGPRVYFSMARDGLLFRWVGAVHPRFRTPHRAIVLQAVWSSVLVATGTYRALFTRVVYTEWIFFAADGGRPDPAAPARRGYRPAYRVRGRPRRARCCSPAAPPLVASTRSSPIRANSAIGLALVLAGLPVYCAVDAAPPPRRSDERRDDHRLSQPLSIRPSTSTRCGAARPTSASDRRARAIPVSTTPATTTSPCRGHRDIAYRARRAGTRRRGPAGPHASPRRARTSRRRSGRVALARLVNDAFAEIVAHARSRVSPRSRRCR